MPSDFTQLMHDLSIVRAAQGPSQPETYTPAPAARAPDDGLLIKSLSPQAIAERREDFRSAVAAGKAELVAMRDQDAARSDYLRKAAMPGPQDFATARQTLAKAIGHVPAAEIARMEARILRFEQAAWMGKAVAPHVMGDDGEANTHSNRAQGHPVQTDTGANIRRCKDLLAQLRTEGKVTPQQAASLEQRINRCETDESVVRPSSPSLKERRAATERAGSLLRDIARRGGLNATEVATFEAQIHGLQQSLGMGEMPNDDAA